MLDSNCSAVASKQAILDQWLGFSLKKSYSQKDIEYIGYYSHCRFQGFAVHLSRIWFLNPMTFQNDDMHIRSPFGHTGGRAGGWRDERMDRVDGGTDGRADGRKDKRLYGYRDLHTDALAHTQITKKISTTHCRHKLFYNGELLSLARDTVGARRWTATDHERDRYRRVISEAIQ